MLHTQYCIEELVLFSLIHMKQREMDNIERERDILMFAVQSVDSPMRVWDLRGCDMRVLARTAATPTVDI